MRLLRAGQFKIPYNYESLVLDNSLNMLQMLAEEQIAAELKVAQLEEQLDLVE